MPTDSIFGIVFVAQHVAQLTNLKRKIADDQRLMDIVDTQR